MTTYAIATGNIKDSEKFLAYGAQAAKTLALFGGEPIAKGKFAEPLCGNAKCDFVVAIKFTDSNKAREWYHSPEYQACIPNRDKACDMNITLYQAPPTA